jgi:hypothetical protein
MEETRTLLRKENHMRRYLARTVLFAFFVLCLSAAASARVGIVITVAPPPLPIYEQPVCPGDGYFWTPGYWAWGDDYDDYYWVPGTWILAPEPGFFWTPGYWGWAGDSFIWNEGFWGPQVGFYGGISYGFGYFGVGFVGGRWDNGHFFYNRAVWNVNENVVHNVYNTTVNTTVVNHVSYNGGNGGVTARATPEEEAAAHGRHVGPVAAQTQHMQQAHSDPQQRASVNQGRPSVAATAKPGDFKGEGVTRASAAGGHYEAAGNRGAGAARPSATHVSDLPAAERPATPNTGDPKQDKKIQKQQDKQYAQQQKERQKLQKQQEKEDQKVARQNNDATKQQVEQRHAQQTQALQQRHQQQNMQMQQRAAPAGGGGRPR